jgi:sugar lactone lactonase YvrE
MASKSTYTTEVLAEGFHFLEGARWHDGRLWMSDIFGQRVHTVALDGAVETLADVPGRPSGLGFLSDGTPLIASMMDRCLLRLENGDLTPHAQLGSLVTGDLNDMVVDGQGRAYVGNMGFDLFGGAEYRNANLVMVDPSGQARVVAEEIEFPNGTVILPGGEVMVLAETWGHRLTAFDIAPDGGLSGRRIFADLGEYGPDGICLDQEGAIWISAFNHCEYLRVLHGGTITHRIGMGERHAVACQLGGDDGSTLFCLTMEGSLGDAAAGTSRARVEVATVDVPGAGSP